MAFGCGSLGNAIDQMLGAACYIKVGESMIKAIAARTLLCGALAVSGIMASLEPAAAAPVRVRFTPEYGAPFPNLEWFGEAVISDGNCTAAGAVSNLFGACAGQFSITSATVYFADKSEPDIALGHIDFAGGQVISVDRDSPAPPDWREIISTPFNPEPGTIDQTLYDPAGALPAQAFFSLVFIGGHAQLYWFQNDPGDFLGDPLEFPYVQWPDSAYYALCYAAGPGDHRVGISFLGVPYNRCGLSDNVGGDSGALSFTAATAVPEPGTFALMLAAALGAMGLQARRRGRKS